MEQEEGTLRVGIVGSGSWATAISKMLLHNVPTLNWHVRDQKNINLFIKTKHNPNYLSAVEFDVNRIMFSTDINEIVSQSDIIIFAVPSAFLKPLLSNLTVPMENKYVISAIKGLVPDENMIVGSYLHKTYNGEANNS